MEVIFYLDIEGEKNVLPVNPGELSVSDGVNNSVVEISELGEVNLSGSKSLTDISFNSLFPKNYNSSYVTPSATKIPPKAWVDKIKKAQVENNRVRLIVTGCEINILTYIENFDWSFNDSTGDIEYSIDFREYVDHEAKYVKTVNQVASPKPRPRPAVSSKIVPGCEVIVNGQLHRDSYGTGPGVVERNAHRKVNFIELGRSHPYHVTLLNGGWRGWVTKGSVRRIK